VPAIDLANGPTQADITVYLAGGAHAFSSGLYSMHVPPTGLLFTYPPFAALAFVPLAHLPALAARVVWAGVNSATLTGLVFVTLRAARPFDPSRTAWRRALLCTGPATLLDPVIVNFILGQINILLALLVAADLLGSRRIGSLVLPEGLLTGVAAAIKLTPLLLVPYLFLIGKRAAAACAAATFVACEAIAFACSPSSSWTYWSKDLFDSSRAGGLLYISDQNLQSVVARFDHATVPGTVVWPLAALVGAGGLAVAVTAYRRSSPLLGLLVCEATALVVSPISWVHHFVWVVPAIIWMAVAADRPSYGPYLAGATSVLFWAAPIWWVPNQQMRELRENAWELVAGNSFFLATLAFLAGVAVLVRTRKRPARTPSLP
jgi:alpha-1,2-mannosyltransferase